MDAAATKLNVINIPTTYLCLSTVVLRPLEKDYLGAVLLPF
jgi:hypothetical protein